MSSCRTGYPIHTTLITGAEVPYGLGHRPKLPQIVMKILTDAMRPDTPPGALKSRIMQTMFRESEAQTDPYEVDIYPPDPGLEILTLGWLSWNHGLPAGMREVIVIERARQKRAWEKALPKPVNDVAREIRDMILAAIEINEWTYREVEMAALGSLRVELAERCLREGLERGRKKCEDLVLSCACRKAEEGAAVLGKLRRRYDRRLRRLRWERDNFLRKPRRDIVTALSERRGCPAKLLGQKLQSECIEPESRYWNVFTAEEVVTTAEGRLADRKRTAFDYIENSKPRNRTGKTLCVHLTKWTLPNLEVLYMELKKMRHQTWKSNVPCRLMVRRPESEVSLTHSVQTYLSHAIADEDEYLYQASLYLQKTIKGRAIQSAMFEGRVKCQELLDELKCSVVLRGEGFGQLEEQRRADIARLSDSRKREILETLTGGTVGETLDFLDKELARLQNERLTHAYALMADRERNRREAEEAGRRQREMQRRAELDEMYKRIMKDVQDSVQMIEEDYDTYARGMYAAHRARQKAEDLAKRIDLAANQAHLAASQIAREEIVADLVFNFALPETERMLVRERLRKRQLKYLASCHDLIYEHLEKCFSDTPCLSRRPLPSRDRQAARPLRLPTLLVKSSAFQGKRTVVGIHGDGFDRGPPESPPPDPKALIRKKTYLWQRGPDHPEVSPPTATRHMVFLEI